MTGSSLYGGVTKPVMVRLESRDSAQPCVGQVGQAGRPHRVDHHLSARQGSPEGLPELRGESVVQNGIYGAIRISNKYEIVILFGGRVRRKGYECH